MRHEHVGAKLRVVRQFRGPQVPFEFVHTAYDHGIVRGLSGLYSGFIQLAPYEPAAALAVAAFARPSQSK